MHTLNHIYRMCKTGVLGKDICVLWLPLAIGHRVVFRGCHRLFFIWQQQITTNIFAQRVPHRYRELLWICFNNDYNVILDLRPPLYYFIVSFESSLIPTWIKKFWKKCDSGVLKVEVVNRKWENIAKWFEWLKGFEVFIKMNANDRGNFQYKNRTD